MMRVVMVLGVLTILIIMALALIVYGQHLTEAKLILQNKQLGQKDRARVNQLKERQWMENQLKEQLEWKKKNVEDIESGLKQQAEQERNQKTAFEACQADKNKIDEKMAPIQKEQSDVEAKFKTEKEAWNGTITNLKRQMEQRSTICDFVKKNSTDPNVMKLCSPKEGAAKVEDTSVQAKSAPISVQ